MKMSRRILALVLAGCLLLAAVGCGKSDSAAGVYTPGIYSASERGYGGDVTVTITVDADKITDVKVEGPGETESIGGAALETLASSILDAQSAEIDGVAGATLTSDAAKTAAAAAIEAAKGNVAEVGELAFTPGTYTGTGEGYGGPVELAVTFTEDAITSIEVVSSSETDHVGTPAFDIVGEEIMEFTSTGVDGLAGATFTSNAILAAVEDAAAQAGCDVAALREGKIPYEVTPGEAIEKTFDVVVVGAGGAGVAAAAQAAQDGATVCIVEKEAEAGGNTLVAGCSYQNVADYQVWDPKNPDATTGVCEYNGETYDKATNDMGRLDTLRMILNWSEEPFDETVDTDEALTVEEYDLPNRGVHAEYLETLQTLKAQIQEYLDWADAKIAAGAQETDLTVFSTPELHIFQTYYGGLRLSNDHSYWIYSNIDLVCQVVEQIGDTKAWMADQGSVFDWGTTCNTLIGCMWQRINTFVGGVVDGVEDNSKYGCYFAVPINTVLKANEANEVMYRTTAKSLITDDTGRVTGVTCEMYDGTPVTLHANKAVILATGGYAANIEMVLGTNEYWNAEELSASILTTNRSLAQGEGITMAQEVGAAVTGMGFTQLMPLGWADDGKLAGGMGEDLIFVSPAGTENEGKRFVDESAERDVLSQGQLTYGGENGLTVQLQNGGDNTSANNREGKEYFCTLAEAAELTGISADTLRETIMEYDTAYFNGELDSLDVPKSAANAPIGNYNEDGSFNEEGILSVRFLAPSTHHTMGGLVVDEQRHVLTEDGSIIPGLYAAGEVTGGIFAGNRLGGNAITEILVSGRIAGQAAAAE